jgi:L-alanine-DL-glutamate epimerase-like enolase superfamily enzyme
MLGIRHKSVQLPFRHPFTISKGTKTHQPTFLVELEWKGVRGYGEAPAISYYGISVEKMASDLEAKRPMLERFALTDPERYWHFLHHLFPKNSFLVCALDMAGWDLFAKLRGLPLYRMFGLDPATAPVTDLTIGIDTVEKMQEKVRETPWPVYKVKAGMEGDLEKLEGVRSVTDAVLRVDVNGGWDLPQAERMLPLFKDLGVELVEQPLSISSGEENMALKALSPLPIFADESCVSEGDVDGCAAGFHGVNIKLTKCGGITPARRMIARARQLGLSVMLGCMCESSIGTAAMAHLAPAVDHLDADGPLLLSEDLATGLTYRDGRLVPSASPGLGIDLIEPF